MYSLNIIIVGPSNIFKPHFFSKSELIHQRNKHSACISQLIVV